MSKIKITVPKLHCVKRTDPLGKDKVYCALIVATGTLNDLAKDSTTLPKVVFAKISPVNNKIKKGTIRSLDLGEEWIADIGNAEAVTISFGLYEKDGGDIYNTLKSELKKLPDPNNANITGIISEIWSAIKKNIGEKVSIDGLVESIIEIGVKVFKEFRKDDIIGDVTFSFEQDDPSILYSREYEMRGGNSKYNIQLLLEKTE